MKSVRSRQRRHSALVLGVSALCLALGTAPASLAAGTPGQAHHAGVRVPPDGMSWHTYQLMMAQAPLDAAATKIQKLAARPGPAHRGFFETAVNDTRHTLTLYWHGQVPDTMRQLIGSLRATVDVRVVKTRYSLATLNRDVLTAIRAHRGVTGGAPLTGGGGIELDVTSANLHAVGTVMRSRLGVPVVTKRAGAAQDFTCAANSSDPVVAGTRCDDFENFWGGDVIQERANPNVIATFCTGGFGVHNSAGGEYMITAEHCADNGSGYANGIQFHNGQDPNHWQFVGPSNDVTGGAGYDTMVIPTGTGNQYYDGPSISNGDTTHTKIVAGQQAVSVGDSLCESGSFGGVQCASPCAS